MQALRQWGLIFVLACDAAAVANPPVDPPSVADRLAELENRAPKPDGSSAEDPLFRADFERLIESNELQSADAYWHAVRLLSGPIADFRTARVRYELLLIAIAKQHPGAVTNLPLAWDMVLCKLGRPMRYDAAGLVALNPESGAFAIEPPPESIRTVWQDSASARRLAMATEDNAEVQAITEADQAPRQNWSTLTPDEQHSLPADDHSRNARIREIVNTGGLHTATDFARASLVLQHSGAFEGYRLAHELAVCALLLGDRGLGRWLVAATYDRMLVSVGLEQRFGTQGAPIINFTGTPHVADVDERGICDTQRHALGCSSLADKRSNFFAPLPRE